MKIFKKLFAVVLGCVFVLLAFEFFLRVIYSTNNVTFEKNRIDKNADYQLSFNILILGNSHTEGAGVDKKSAYAGVLQNFFDKNLIETKYKVNVFNGGISNANTYDIYNHLDSFIEKSKPHLALIMAGEPNIWNKVGYSEFAEIKKYADESPFIRAFIWMTKYSKALRWIFNFNNLTKKVDLTDEQKIDYIVYKELNAIEQHLMSIPSITDTALVEKYNSLNSYVDRNRSHPNKSNWRIILYDLAKFEYYGFNQQENALDHIQESMNYNSEIFDVTAYLFLNDILKRGGGTSKVAERAKKLLEQLKSSSTYPGSDKLDSIVNYVIKGYRLNLDAEGVYEFLLSSNQYFPTFPSPAVELSEYYRQKINDHQKSDQIKIETMIANPFTSRTSLGKDIINMAADQYPNMVAHKMAKEFIADFNQKFPSEKHVFDLSQDKLLYDWIYWGMDQIIDKFLQQKIKPVIQNYHWIRDRQEAELLYRVSEDIARNRNISFINTHSEFLAVAGKNPEEVETYFVQIYGANDSHPSEKGHKLIAYIIYKNLVSQKLLPDELSHLNAEDILK